MDSWVVTGPHSLADPHVVPLSLKVVVALWQVCSCFISPLPSYLQSSTVARDAPSGQGIDGVDWRCGLGALVAFRFLLVLFDSVLADEGAIFVELALAAFAVVHQAVVTLLLLDGAVQRCLAALQWLVVLITGRRETESDPVWPARPKPGGVG